MYFSSDVPLTPPGQDLLSYSFSSSIPDEHEPLIIDAEEPRRSFSRAQVRELVAIVATNLRARGVEPGDCVVCHSRNDIHTIVLAYAVIALGAVFCPPSFLSTEDEMVHNLSVVGADWLYVEPDFLPLVSAAMERSGIDRGRLAVFDPPGRPCSSTAAGAAAAAAGLPAFSALLTPPAGQLASWKSFDRLEEAMTVPILRMFTSGTTGLPKAAQLPTTNITHTAEARLKWIDKAKDFKVRFLHAIPLFHITGWPVTACALRRGTKLFLSRAGPEPAERFLTIERLAITELFVPPMLIAAGVHLLSTGEIRPSALASLRHIISAGAPVQAEMVAKFKKLAQNPGLAVISGYGSTEGGGIAGLPWPKEPSASPFPVGVIFPGTKFKLKDLDTDEDISTYDKPGELCVQSPCLAIDYYNNPEATRRAFFNDAEGRWLRMGDILTVNAETKHWTLLGRCKEVFKVRYEEVAPAEIEELLVSRCEGVADAAIGPVKADATGELEVKAWIVKREGSDLSVERVASFLKDRVAQHKLPTGGVSFIPAIPRNISGKIVRGKLLLM